MTVANAVDIDVFSLLVLAFLFTNASRRAEHAFTHHRLFMAMAGVLAALLVFDAVARVVDGLPGQAATLANWASNLLLYLTVPLVPFFWLLYADYQVYHDEKRFRKVAVPLAVYTLINTVLTLGSVFNGWFFWVDAANVYHRGWLVILHPFLCYLFLLYSFAFVIANRKRIDERHFTALLFFPVFPAVGGMLQCSFYGLSLVWSGLTLSMLLLYLHIQDRRLNTDYLTGVFNRRQLDCHIADRIRMCAKRRCFAAILIDLDGFKKINDTHGHDAGDDALLSAVGVLRGSLRNNDFIARYGGDEFLAVLDIDSPGVLEEAVGRVREGFERFNLAGGRPYALSVSCGHAVYDPAGGLDAAGFLRHVDALMYQDKKRQARMRG